MLCLWAAPLFAQYYLRGEIKNAQGNAVAFAGIRLYSKPSIAFNSGASGGFGIPVSQKTDTIKVTLEGYETLIRVVSVTTFQSLVMKLLEKPQHTQGNGLMSFTRSTISNRSAATTVSYGGETYTSLAENDFVRASDVAETSLALNINSASYSNIRRFINMHSAVPPDGVRIEEMLNYFSLNKTGGDSVTDSFHFNTQLTTCPWNTNNKLFFIRMYAPRLNLSSITPAKFIFLIDISGSMDKDNRLPLVQSAFKFLVHSLRAEDTIAIVTYGGSVGIALPPTSGAEKEKIISVIESLRADGDTPGSQAIQTAYDIAEKIADTKSNNRIILATDGDFNIGQTSDKELENIVKAHKQKGIYLTCLGAGMGNYKDSRLEMLAKMGNGNFAYIDNIEEAQKTMVTEFAKNMYAVANNASLHVYFNAATIKSYRLIGYDNRKDVLQDTSLTDGGELGSGQIATAIFEIESNTTNREPLATLQLQYQLPQNGRQQVKKFTAHNHFISLDSASSDVRFAASVCMFGSLLKHSKFAYNYSWDDIAALAKSAYDANNISEKEFIELIEKAKEIYTDTGEKKKHR